MTPASPARSLRIRPHEVLARRGPVLFLDARSAKAWNASQVRIPGAVRIQPLRLAVDPSWRREDLIVVYCA